MALKSNGPLRLVLARPDRIGDVVITSSCLEPIRRALPDAEIHFVAQSRMEPLFSGHPAISSFITVPTHKDTIWRQERLADRLRSLKADCIVHLHSDPEVEWAAAAADIPRRIGFRENGDKWLTESLPDLKKSGEKHEGFYNFDLLHLLDVPPPAKLKPRLTPDSEAFDSLTEKLPDGISLGRYAVLHVGAHGKKPRIAAEFFIAVARWLVKERHLYVVLLGAPEDIDMMEVICAGSGSASAWMLKLSGQTDLAEAAFLLRDAAIVFGRDSGPAHIAAAMGASTVSLMLDSEATNSSRRWAPLGERSWVLDKPLERGWFESKIDFGRRNLEQYTLDEIIDSLDYALKMVGAVPAESTVEASAARLS
jgi:ADP-heptose:LPS heptosyltransferase